MVYESKELDQIFRLVKEVSVDGKKVEEASYPKKLWKWESIQKWKQDNMGMRRMFKVVHISHPMSNFNRYGPFGTRPITDR